MSEEVKMEVIRNTQDSLSKYIKKPPLTEKLLRKPPFRYLHDITTSVMKETGYLQGLYSQDELNPENIKDREAKISFLEKLIAAVNLSTGVNLAVRPSKIVAGLDVAKTNELLQTIAKALDKNVDSSKAVEQVLNKRSKGVNQQSSSKKESLKSKPKKETKPVEAKVKEPRTNEALRKKTKEKIKTEVKSDSRKTKPKKDVLPTAVGSTSSVDEPEAAKGDSEPREVLIPDPPVTSAIDEQINSESNADSSSHNFEPHDKAEPPVSPPAPLPTSTTEADKQDKENIPTEHKPEVVQEEVKSKREEDSKLEEDLKRPQSARAVHRKKPVSRKPSAELDAKSASKNVIDREESVSKESKENVAMEIKDIHEKKSLAIAPTGSEGAVKVAREGEVVRRERPKTAARPASARPGAPRVRDRGTVLLADTDNKVVSEPVNLIVDSKDLLKDDDETLVTVETAAAEVIPDQVGGDSQLEAEDQGHLVSQILETQKELEDTSLTNSTVEPTAKVDISWSSGRQEAVVREVDKLRSAIQALTRAANPLGKLIDCLQEDIESMQGELETWTKTNHQLTQQLQAEERLTEESIEPLARQLEDISQLVEEQLEETSIVKAAVIRNDERITRLLSASHPPR